VMSVKVRPFRRGGWEVDIILRMPDGEHVRERVKAPVSSRSAATRWGEAREREMLLGYLRRREGKEAAQNEKRKKKVPTLAEFAPRFIQGYARANRHKPSGIAAKESVLRLYLLPWLGEKRLDKINAEDVQRIKAELAAKNPKTVNNVLTVLSKLLKIAIEWKELESMPARVELLKVGACEFMFYDFDEYDRLVRAAEQHDPRAHLMVLLGGDAGLRRGEIIALEWSDIDFERNYICVARSEWNGHVTVPKGGKPRRVPMTERLRAALDAHRHLRGDRVLYRNDGGTMTSKVLRKLMESVQRRANFRVTGSVHPLRHTFCSHLAMQGAAPRAVQELAGHRHINTTMRYMHLSPRAMDSAIKLLDGRRRDQQRGDVVETAKTGT
jgi:integrase